MNTTRSPAGETVVPSLPTEAVSTPDLVTRQSLARDSSERSGNRRQLLLRRTLVASTVDFETVWDLDVPTITAEEFDIELGVDFSAEVTDFSVQSTMVPIEVPESISSIDVELPDDNDSVTTPKEVLDDLPNSEFVVDRGSKTFACGTAAATISAIMWLF